MFLETNAAFAQLTGLNPSDLIGKRVTEVIPGIRADRFDWIGVYGETAVSRKPVDFEQYFPPLDRWYRIHAFSPEPLHFASTFIDVSARNAPMRRPGRTPSRLPSSGAHAGAHRLRTH